MTRYSTFLAQFCIDSSKIHNRANFILLHVLSQCWEDLACNEVSSLNNSQILVILILTWATIRSKVRTGIKSKYGLENLLYKYGMNPRHDTDFESFFTCGKSIKYDKFLIDSQELISWYGLMNILMKDFTQFIIER